MRALLLRGRGFDALELSRVPIPQPAAGQLLARVDAAGVCTSLLKLIDQGANHSYLYGWDTERFPLILGDEGAVTLVQVGAALQERYRVGERYVIQPAVDHAPINYRERYRDHGQAVHKVAVGYTLPGHLAEYILIPEEVIAAGCLLPIGELAAAHAAMAEPLSCVVSAHDHHLHLYQDSPQTPRRVEKGLRPGGVTVVIGAGAMGRMHVELALHYRPRAVIVADRLPERLELSQRLFAAKAQAAGVVLHTVLAEGQALETKLAQVSQHHGADDVIVAVGVAQAIESAQQLVGRGGVLNVFGGLQKGQDHIQLDTGRVHYGEIVVTGSSGGSPWDVAQTLQLLQQGTLEASKHIALIGDLDHAPQVLAMMRRQELDGKAILYPHRSSSQWQRVQQWQASDEAAYLGAKQPTSASISSPIAELSSDEA